MYHVRCEIVRCILKIEKIIFPYNYNFTLLQFWGFTAHSISGGGREGLLLVVFSVYLYYLTADNKAEVTESL